MTASSGSAQKSAAWSKPVADSQSRDHESATVAGRQRPFLLRGAGGGRPQRPGLPVALCAFLEVFPSAIRFRELPAATGSAAIIQQDQERSRFAESTVVQFRVMGNKKFRRVCAEPVDDANSLWKAEEN